MMSNKSHPLLYKNHIQRLVVTKHQHLPVTREKQQIMIKPPGQGRLIRQGENTEQFGQHPHHIISKGEQLPTQIVHLSDPISDYCD
jgi:hypothetical protein